MKRLILAVGLLSASCTHHTPVIHRFSPFIDPKLQILRGQGIMDAKVLERSAEGCPPVSAVYHSWEFTGTRGGAPVHGWLCGELWTRGYTIAYR